MQIKGGVLVARADFVKRHFGESGWKQVLEALPAADAKILKGTLLSPGWYPFDLGSRLDDAIVRVLGQNDFKVFERIGAASADTNLSTIHKHFLAPGRPHDLLVKTPVIYGFYYDKGRREYAKAGPTAAVLTTHDAEAFSTADCLTIIGWHKRALELCGAKNVTMVEEVCRAKGGNVCRYRVSWETA
jgi:hypothetical protein